MAVSDAIKAGSSLSMAVMRIVSGAIVSAK